MTASWMKKASARADQILTTHGVRLTLGGEPTYVPILPEGAEWSYAAVGPTKLGFAEKVATALQKDRLAGAAVFFCPGKLYPGEVNPRWTIRLLANRDGSPLFRPSKRHRPLTPRIFQEFANTLCDILGIPPRWVRFSDPQHPQSETLALPLDHTEGVWRSAPWPLDKKSRILSTAEGPAGLRLPLHLLPPALPRRVLSLERSGTTVSVFFPPLLQDAFLELLAAVESASRTIGLAGLRLQGYLPADEAARWTPLGLAADPGVLEINLPACASWTEYSAWLDSVTTACEAAGLRSWKESPEDFPQGTGGGNHLLWGGASLDDHPFFTRPAWLASVLRFWQHHPSLAYLFTGCYVGASSQAPRPDESARNLADLEIAYAFLESLPPGDHRELINETLRHLHTDISGNTHRSEISFDKFWNVGQPSGAWGLIEFRAIESLPRADWMAAVALLWTALAAHLLEHPCRKALVPFGAQLTDAFFLPHFLWTDLEKILTELEKSGISLDRRTFRQIWNWRFPTVLRYKSLTVRKALENWPLLCETPREGGSTSRFVDTSLHRLEFHADAPFAARYALHAAGRALPLRTLSDTTRLVGLRTRRTRLVPSLHPGIPVQMPLEITLLDRQTGRVAACFTLEEGDLVFRKIPAPQIPLGGPPCRGVGRGALTCDLRLH